MTPEDIDELQKAYNIMTFVRSGLIDGTRGKALLGQSLDTLAALILGRTEIPTIPERVETLEQKVRDLSRING